MDLEYGITLILVVGVIIIGYWLISPYIPRKKKWFKIWRADGYYLLYYRTRKEPWRTDLLRFDDERGHKHTLHWHWIMDLEEIPEKEIEVIKSEIEVANALKAARDSGEA